MDESFTYLYDQIIDADEHEEQQPFQTPTEQQSAFAVEDPFANAFDAGAPFPLDPGMQGVAGPTFVPNEISSSLATFTNTHELNDFQSGYWTDFGAPSILGGVDGRGHSPPRDSPVQQSLMTRANIPAVAPFVFPMQCYTNDDDTPRPQNGTDFGLLLSDTDLDNVGHPDENLEYSTPTLASTVSINNNNDRDVSPDLQHAQASSASSACRCIACLMKRKPIDLGLCPNPKTCDHIKMQGVWWVSRHEVCPVVDCFFIIHGYSYSRWRDHMRSHCVKEVEYQCAVKHCPLANKRFKRWADLIRHTKNAHCKIAEVYHCHVLDCKYHDRLIFRRKDNLTSHVRNVHAGYVAPGQGPRKLKPAAKKGEKSGTETGEGL